MKTVKLQAHLAHVAGKARALEEAGKGISTEALRNRRQKRTPAKRILLQRAEQRARAAGKKPVISQY